MNRANTGKWGLLTLLNYKEKIEYSTSLVNAHTFFFQMCHPSTRLDTVDGSQTTRSCP